MPRRLARALGPIAGLTLGACTFAGPNLPITSVAPAAHRASGASTEFVGFWESWSDTNRNDAFYRLQSVPGSVTSVDVAFSIADGNEISPPQNTYPLQPGAKRVHARGGRLLLSFGGATSPFDITDPPLFAANLRTYAKAHPKLYDGFDFDDEVIPSNGPQQLVDVILAVRQAFPSAVISFDAFVDGADAQPGSGHQGEDIPVIEQAGSAIDYVNVMAYDQYGWKPPGDPNCSYQEGSQDDCRLDVLKQFASIQQSGGGDFSEKKIVLGLMIGEADDGEVITAKDASGYAREIRRRGYRGMMIWDLDRDNPQAPPNGTGDPKGTYVHAIAHALGTKGQRR